MRPMIDTRTQIRQIRLCLGLTQNDVAKGIYASVSLVSKLEQGVLPIDPYKSALLEYFERQRVERLAQVKDMILSVD